uniref:Uncharacterized protein n=1 Tax=Tetraselmis sp. GSL018 TaxID=582737 RepID=A0A061R4M5_9CHLO
MRLNAEESSTTKYVLDQKSIQEGLSQALCEWWDKVGYCSVPDEADYAPKYQVVCKETVQKLLFSWLHTSPATRDVYPTIVSLTYQEFSSKLGEPTLWSRWWMQKIYPVSGVPWGSGQWCRLYRLHNALPPYVRLQSLGRLSERQRDTLATSNDQNNWLTVQSQVLEGLKQWWSDVGVVLTPSEARLPGDSSFACGDLEDSSFQAFCGLENSIDTSFDVSLNDMSTASVDEAGELDLSECCGEGWSEQLLNHRDLVHGLFEWLHSDPSIERYLDFPENSGVQQTQGHWYWFRHLLDGNFKACALDLLLINLQLPFIGTDLCDGQDLPTGCSCGQVHFPSSPKPSLVSLVELHGAAPLWRCLGELWALQPPSEAATVCEAEGEGRRTAVLPWVRGGGAGGHGRGPWGCCDGQPAGAIRGRHAPQRDAVGPPRCPQGLVVRGGGRRPAREGRRGPAAGLWQQPQRLQAQGALPAVRVAAGAEEPGQPPARGLGQVPGPEQHAWVPVGPMVGVLRRPADRREVGWVGPVLQQGCAPALRTPPPRVRRGRPRGAGLGREGAGRRRGSSAGGALGGRHELFPPLLLFLLLLRGAAAPPDGLGVRALP